MENKNGPFSRNLFGLELQLKTLLEEVGGDQALQVLDSLTALNRSEQQVVLRVFDRLLRRIASGSERLVTSEDRVMKDFEEGLYRDILGAMRDAAGASTAPTGRIVEVIEGGKARPIRQAPINLEEARRNRRLRAKQILN